MAPTGRASQDKEHSRSHDAQLSETRITPCSVVLSCGRSVPALSVMLALFIISSLPNSPIRASAGTESQSRTTALPQHPDSICIDCHREIYEKYERTPMARGSGVAVDGLVQGGFLHAASGIRYNVFLRDGKAWMSYNRDHGQETSNEQFTLRGEKQLIYFIGSGHRGRTYLYQENDQWFEVPINYYSKRQLWDMAPNYGATRTMPTALPIDSNCLHCHATSIQTALPEARNKYNGPPFQQAGIGCTACHGDPSKHLAEQGHGPIVNPAKLAPTRRDSVCLQCHLEGDVAIYRTGTSLAQFRAGADLADYVVYFVKASATSGGGRASSQYEALLLSACKVASGDKLTCTTCHDPHSSPSAEVRIGYFRGKCLMCHTGSRMATGHHPEQKDCAACHMPTREPTDISHEQATDHNIQRRTSTTVSTPRLRALVEPDELLSVGNVSAGDRELGLAYAQLAEQGNQEARDKAVHLLRKAERDGASDAQLHTQLGFIEQISGDKMSARKEYADALIEDPYEATALGNLAVLDAASGRTANAVNLLQRVVYTDPSQMAAGLNLAFIECRIGNKKKALDILTGLSRFNPDDPTLRKFLASGAYAGERCDLR
jgi:Tetratricopeptide repeat/Cytochrome c554 and c-prime